MTHLLNECHLLNTLPKHVKTKSAKSAHRGVSSVYLWPGVPQPNDRVDTASSQEAVAGVRL